VQNANSAEAWNTVMMSFPLFAIEIGPNAPNAQSNPRNELVNNLLLALLPATCQQALDPTDTGDSNGEDSGGNDDKLPRAFALNHAYPNPFNPMTTIRFAVPRAEKIHLHVFDVTGRLVRTLVEKKLEAGYQSVVWNGLDYKGRRASSGIYFVHMTAEDYAATQKIVMTK